MFTTVSQNIIDKVSRRGLILRDESRCIFAKMASDDCPREKRYSITSEGGSS